MLVEAGLVRVVASWVEYVTFGMSLRVDVFFFLMIRRPPRSTQSRSSAASDVYKRQGRDHVPHHTLEDGLLGATHDGGNDGLAQCHGLDDGPQKGLSRNGRQHDEVRCRQDLGDVGAMAQALHPAGVAEAPRDLFTVPLVCNY